MNELGNNEVELTEPVILKNEFGKRQGMYDNPEVYKIVVDQRQKNESWDSIAELLKGRGYENITGTQVSNIFTRAMAKAVVTHNTAKEVFDDYTPMLKEMYMEALKVFGTYVKQMRGIIDDINETDAEPLLKKMQIIKTIPIAVGLMREIRGCIDTQISLHDTIQGEVRKDNMDMASFMEQFDKHLKTLEKNGDIKIINPALK